MMANIKSYAFAVTAVVLLSAIVRALFGENNKIIRFVSGMLVLFIMISPVAKLNIDDAARAISRMELHRDGIVTKPVLQNTKLISQLIKEKCETYIIDKATAAGVALDSVDVTVQTGETPFPSHAIICGQFSQRQRTLLAGQIENDLAIPQTEQEWVWENTKE